MPPWLFLVFLLALLAALGYHIVRVSSLRRVPLYWIVITAAMLGCEAIADSRHLAVVRLGDLALIPDILGLAVALAILRLARL
jgi:hypothetical protein